MDKWRTVVGVALVFVLGALSGGLGSGWFLKSRHPLFKKDPEQRVALIMQRLADRLDLTEAQKPAVETVVRRMDDALQRYNEQRRAEVRRIIEAHDEALKPLLSAPQQQALEDFRREMAARFKDQRRSPPP